MKIPRDLSGTELIKLLCKHYGYGRVNQEGSHVIPRNEYSTEAPHFHSRSFTVEDWNFERDP
jgi:predicted RNA binding protein YcfA (HicA-like mRNA interferase family)